MARSRFVGGDIVLGSFGGWVVRRAVWGGRGGGTWLLGGGGGGGVGDNNNDVDMACSLSSAGGQ